MKIFNLDKTVIKREKNKYKWEILIIMLISLSVCLFIFFMHSRKNTIILFPIIILISVTSICYCLKLYLCNIKYLKQYELIVNKALNHQNSKIVRFISCTEENFQRDNLSFKKVYFLDDNNTKVEFYLLFPFCVENEFKENQITIKYVDNILISMEKDYE